MSKKNKKILMLGGSFSQIPAIKYAKKAGYYVITCDYLPDNPGHAFSDEYHNISTTDKDEILNLAKIIKVDGIVAYASDPSAPVAAYVCEALNLPSSTYNSVNILSNKDLFRSFLLKERFNSPRFITINNLKDLSGTDWSTYPCFVKPVDSSGSKGITMVHSPDNFIKAVKYAFDFSRCKKVIIEEYVQTPYNQLHGDGFVLDGELVFLGICDQHFNGAVPFSSTYPSKLSENLVARVKKEVSMFLKKAGYKFGAINVEARITSDNKIYIMEIGPRSGGNYVPQLMQCATGFNEVSAIVETAMGNSIQVTVNKDSKFCMQFIIGAEKSGEFLGITLSKFIEKRVRYMYLHKKVGERVELYENSSNVVGVVIIECMDAEELKNVLGNIRSHVRVLIE
jgi:biotin carboxylase